MDILRIKDDVGTWRAIPAIKGDRGEAGPQGPKGDKGDSGTSFVVTDIYPTLADLQAAFPHGDGTNAYQIEADGNVYLWSTREEGWESMGQIVGPKGDKGDTGAAGPKGDKGDKGDTGETGPAGPQGVKGDKGDKGDTGADGRKGDKGDTGATGPQGPKGDTGSQGPAGQDGVGIPSGGSQGQALIKNSGTDYDTTWLTLDYATHTELNTVANARIPDALVAEETTPSTNNTINWQYE